MIWWGTVRSSVPRRWLPPPDLSWGKTRTEARRILSDRTLLFTEAGPWMFEFPFHFLPISSEESKSKGKLLFLPRTFLSQELVTVNAKSHGGRFSAAPSGLSPPAPESPGLEARPGPATWTAAGGRAEGWDRAVPATTLLRGGKGSFPVPRRAAGSPFPADIG